MNFRGAPVKKNTLYKAQKVKHASEREERRDREGEVNTTGAVGSSLPA